MARMLGPKLAKKGEVPKGDYTIYALVEDPNNWQLIINKDTGQWGLTYDQMHDLGRVKMTMSKPPQLIEVYKMTLSQTGPKSGKPDVISVQFFPPSCVR